MRLVFLGPPGAGKGTQAALLAETRGVLHLSTGAILRASVDAGSPTGLEADRYMSEGRLVPDGVVDRIVKERLVELGAAPGWILDGYPRTLGQAEALDAVVEELGTPLSAVLFLDVDDEVLVKRISGRKEARADDREDVVRQRLHVYREHTRPLVDHYREMGLLKEIDGDQTIEAVAGTVVAAVGDLT